ncbi:MAG: acyl-CoA dehydrogenase family protein [Myxococcota bacterium]
MDFDRSEDQKLLAKTVADFAKKESTVERFRKLRNADGEGFERSTWKQMAELGWLSVPFAEELGGFGGSSVDVGLVLEELGKSLVPEPYLASVVLAGAAIRLAGSVEQQAELLEPLLEGDQVLALAYAERGARYATSRLSTTAEADGSGWVIRGEKVFVLAGHAAERFVVSAEVAGEPGLFVVDADAAGVERATVGLIDGRRGANLRFDGARARMRLEAAPAAEVLEHVMDLAAAAAVAEGVGVCHAMLQMTVEYLKTREQFGAKIGSFQALQHRAVDMFVEMELLRSIALEAVGRADATGEGKAARQAAISAAKLQLATGGAFIARQAIQLHGGIGVTDEHDVGLYFKRLHALMSLFGDEAFHARRYAQLQRG